jgi:hypothetical protein
VLTTKAVRELALSLPEATEAPHFERTSFRVRKKIFATMAEKEHEAVVWVAPREKLYGLLRAQPDVFIDHGGWTRMGALGVRLDRVDAAQFRELLIASWRSRAPQRALAAYDAGAGTTTTTPARASTAGAKRSVSRSAKGRRASKSPRAR